MKITRRSFLAAASAVAGGFLRFPGLSYGQSARPQIPELTDALSRLTWDSFYPFQYTDFTFGEGSNAVPLRLSGMVDTAPKNSRKRRGEECFELRFQGPPSSELEQGTYAVNHFRLGDFQLFITPGRNSSRAKSYTAVINRVLG